MRKGEEMSAERLFSVLQFSPVMRNNIVAPERAVFHFLAISYSTKWIGAAETL
jgi:hypothetical protein